MYNALAILESSKVSMYLHFIMYVCGWREFNDYYAWYNL